MKKSIQKEKNYFFLSTISITSILFTAFSLIFNAFYAIIIPPDLPSIGFNFVFLGVSLLISLAICIITLKLKKNLYFKKLNFIYIFTFINTIAFLSVNLSTIFFDDIWNIFTVLIIFVLSLIITAICLFIPINNYFIKSIIYYVIIAIPYFIITLGFGKYGEGNKIIIVFFVYTIVYTVARIVSFILLELSNNIKNSKKEYSKKFK